MCFKPDSKMKKPEGNWGYKVFRIGKNGKLSGDYSRPRKKRKCNTWLNEKDFRPTGKDLIQMGAQKGGNGWGIFLLKKDANFWRDYADNWRGKFELKVVKVKFKNILNVGTCQGMPTVLAKEIFIPE